MLLGAALFGLARAPVSAQPYVPYPFSISGPTSATAGSTVTYRLQFDTESATGDRTVRYLWSRGAEYVGGGVVSGNGTIYSTAPLVTIVGPGRGELEIQIRIPTGMTEDFVIRAYEPGTMTSGTGELHTSILPAGAIVPATTAVSTSTSAAPFAAASPRPPATGNAGLERERGEQALLLVPLGLAAMGFAVLLRRHVAGRRGGG